MTADTGVLVRCPNHGKPGAGLRHTTFAGLRSRAPKRARCAVCGGRLYTVDRVWAAVDHRPDGRYTRPAQTFPTPEQAESAAAWEQVVRPFDPAE